jgi:hypothetical protein
VLQHIKTLGKATLYRSETYNHRTTPLIEWIVKVGDRIVAQCATRREALEWLTTYST